MSVFRKEPVIVDQHHEVLYPWAELRRELPQSPRVLTLDFHTDTLSALRRGIFPPAEGVWQDESLVRQAVAMLHHDEHFDWALRAGLIEQAVILAETPQNGPYGHPGMVVRPFTGLPDLNALLNTPETVRFYADTLLSERIPDEIQSDFGKESKSWILDIDCDVFLTGKGTDFPPDGCFAHLVRSAAMITLSRESDWVRLLRLSGETISGDSLAEKLYQTCLNLRTAC